jgi:16S rRNA (guanine527-N7)-methyltransferase
VSKLIDAGNRSREKRRLRRDRWAVSADFSDRTDRGLLLELARALGAQLDEATTQSLARYLELVVTWNRKLDLTAARGARAQLEVLLGDALVLAEQTLIPHAVRIVDVGSGAGAPALPLLLLRPDLRGTLVEPLRKRVAFLRTALGTLSLVERVRVLEAKLNASTPTLPDPTLQHDVALSRATFAPELWAPAALQLAPVGIVMLASQEPPPAPQGCRLMHTRDYTLPWSGASRRIAVYARGEAA